MSPTTVNPKKDPSIRFKRASGESHEERILRLYRLGVSKSDIVRWSHSTRAQVQAVCGDLEPSPALGVGRKCWLEPVGFVRVVAQALEGDSWFVLNKWGEEVLVREEELVPLGLAA